MSRYTCACGTLVQAVNDGKAGDYHAECPACYYADKAKLAEQNKKARFYLERDSRVKQPSAEQDAGNPA